MQPALVIMTVLFLCALAYIIFLIKKSKRKEWFPVYVKMDGRLKGYHACILVRPNPESVFLEVKAPEDARIRNVHICGSEDKILGCPAWHEDEDGNDVIYMLGKPYDLVEVKQHEAAVHPPYFLSD